MHIQILFYKRLTCMSYYSIHSCMHTIWPFQLWLGVGRSKLLVDNNCRTSYKLSLVCIISRWNCGWLVLLCKICCRYTYIRRYRTTVLCMNEFNMLFICIYACIHAAWEIVTHIPTYDICVQCLLCYFCVKEECTLVARLKRI